MKKAWETKTLGEVCEVFADGDWVESKDQSSEGIRLIQTGNVGEGVYKDRSEKARYISESTFRRLRCTEIFEGDCLVSRLPDPVGRSCILPSTGERMITAVDCTILRFNTKQLLPAFFNHYSQSVDYLASVAKECTGTTRNRISRSNLGRIPIPVPPLPEQQRIVALLDEAFAGLVTAKANAEQNLQNARALFESHLHLVFAQRGWPIRRLGDLSEMVTKGTTPTSVGHSFVQQGINFVKIESITKTGRFIEEKFAHITAECHEDLGRSRLAVGDILFSIAGALGRTALVTDEILPANTNQALAIIRLKSDTGLLPKFVLKALETGVVLEQIEQFRGGAAQQNLSLTQVRDFQIVQPPLAEQQKIVANLDALSEESQRLTRLYERKLAVLDELKKSLLHQAFNGEL